MAKQQDWKKSLKADPTDWLLESADIGVRYLALRDLTKADVWQQAATSKNLQEICVFSWPEGRSWGTLLVRNIFHTWCHLGEISSIRQILGHRPPEFVDMYEWAYDGS